jgi:hypothetical protein
MSVSLSSLEIAPGRDAWIFVSTFLLQSATAMAPVPPDVSFESSAPDVARVNWDSSGVAHLIAMKVGSAVITVRSHRDPANVKSFPVTVVQALRGNEEGLVMSASARLVATPSPPQQRDLPGPMDLDVRVTIANPTNGTKDIWLSRCPAWIRIYSTSVDTGRPLADVPRGVRCDGLPQQLILAPSESKSFRAEGYRLTSADTLPNTQVFVFAAVDRIRDLVNVPAGRLNILSPNAGLALGALTSVTGPDADTLRARVTITDTTSSPVRLEYGACSLSLLAYRSPARTGAPVWNSMARRSLGGLRYGCPAYLAVGVVQPGQTSSPREFNVTYPVREILGDSLSNGRYYFIALVRLNWRQTAIGAGDAELRR